jgi:hypothetical protein
MSPRPILSRRAITGAVTTDVAAAAAAAAPPVAPAPIVTTEPSTGQKIVGTAGAAVGLAGIGAMLLIPVAVLALIGTGAYYLYKKA